MEMPPEQKNINSTVKLFKCGTLWDIVTCQINSELWQKKACQIYWEKNMAVDWPIMAYFTSSQDNNGWLKGESKHKPFVACCT